MAHTLAGYTIIVQQDVPINRVLAAELNVLDSTQSVVQHFSKPSERRRITGLVFGETDHNAVKALSSGSSAVNYTNDKGSQGNWYVLAVQSDRRRGTPIGFSGVSVTDSIWEVDIEMIKAP